MIYNKTTIGNKTKHTTEFNSLTEFYDYVTKTPNNKIFKNESYLSSRDTRDNSKSFSGTKSFEEAVELLKNGWEEKAKELDKKLKIENIKLKPHTKQMAQFDMVGFQASVPRYLQGIPTSMINKKNIPQKQKIITINKSISYHASIQIETIMENSIKALQIIQQLEAQGFRCNLNIIWGIRDNYNLQDSKEINVLKIRLKSANERLNISKLAFPLVHPSMLRRISFKFVEVSPTFTLRSYTDGYGYPLKDEVNEDADCYKNNKEYFLPRFIDNIEEEIKNILK